MKITPDLIKYLETLARIDLTEDEEKVIGPQLQEILTYVDTLNELDTEGVEPMSHSFPISNVMREDKVAPSLTAEEITKNAPESQDGAFVVPKTFD